MRRFAPDSALEEAGFEPSVPLYILTVSDSLLVGPSHGDIKPQNILISAECVKLTDFGSSVLPEDMYARTRENGGTILYSAPEIVGATLATRDSSARYLSDVYSLGVLLYHLVTARLPHDTLSQVARHVPFARARELNSSVSQALDDFIEADRRSLGSSSHLTHRWRRQSRANDPASPIRRQKLPLYSVACLPNSLRNRTGN